MDYLVWLLLSIVAGGLFLTATALGVSIMIRSRTQPYLELGNVSQRWLTDHAFRR